MLVHPLLKRAMLAAALLTCLAVLQPGTIAAEPSPPPPAALSVPAAKIVSTVNQVDDSRFPLVIGYVTALDDNGSPLAGLTKASFDVLEDGLALSEFDVAGTINVQQPLAVALVLDISGSMEGKAFDYARQAAISFLDVLGPRDTVALISFSSSVKVNIPFTATKSIVAVGIQNLRAGGDTALYDAVNTAVQSLSQLPPGRKVVVLMTDGEDTKSKLRSDEALAIVSAKRVPVFTVGLGDNVDRGALDALSRSSGGRAVYAPSPSDLAGAYRSLADQLRSQYAITASSRLRADGKEHKLLVRLRYAGTSAEGQGIFVARPSPPWIDIVAPRPSQVVTAALTVEVDAQPNAATARISRLDVAVDGLSIGSVAEPPLTATLKPGSLAPGEHALKATAQDSAGNMASQEINFTVFRPMAVAVPTAIAEPTPVATHERAAEPGLPAEVLAGVLLFLCIGTAAFVTARTRRRSAGLWITCPHCGTHFSGRSSCPTCAVEDRRNLLLRLREVVARAEDQPEEEAVPRSRLRKRSP